MSNLSIRVALGSRSYEVVVGSGMLSTLGGRARQTTGARAALLVIDDGLPAPLVELAERSLVLAGLVTTRCPIHASERDKSMATVQRVVEAAAGARLERADAVVALGGGVVGDIAGFAASIYRRGLAVVQCPTTLLSMVDASVGGKTGANLIVGAPNGSSGQPGQRLLKNMVGTFHQPRLVLSDVHALRSLPHRHLRAGLAECIKHALISADAGDNSLLDAMEKESPAIASGRATEEVLIRLIARNVAVKANVVSRDEFEQGPAALVDSRTNSAAAPGAAADICRESLNLGHTFGHALEAMEHLSPDADPTHAPLHHGEAVALGLIAATATAEALAQIPAGSTTRVRAIIESVGLPSRVAGLPSDDAIIAAMMDDKKVTAGMLRLVLPWGELGRVRIAEAPTKQSVAAGLAAIRKE